MRRNTHPIRGFRVLTALGFASVVLAVAACGQADERAPAAAEQADPTPWWSPPAGVTWQWQLIDPVDTSVEADVYDIDLFDTPPATIDELHRLGRNVVCYVSAGTWEDWRPDAGDFPEDVIGGETPWEGERWLDIRRIDILEPLLGARFDLCATKGFDAVEADNVDAYRQDTGFALSGADQLAFNRMLADLAHERGLGIGLKNDLEQVTELFDLYDFAINEQCVELGECDALAPFVRSGKAVLHAEYAGSLSAVCEAGSELGLSSIVKRPELDAWIRSCS